MVFGQKICKKRQIWASDPILGKLGVMHDLGWWLTGLPMVDFLFSLIEPFQLSITVLELWGEMYTARLFSQGGRFLCTHIYLDRVISHQPFLVSEN